MIVGVLKSLWNRLLGRRVMTCREATDFLTAYMDNELATPVRGEFDRHLHRCSSCRTYLETYKKTVEMGKSACRCSLADATTEMPEELVNAILAASGRVEGRGEGQIDGTGDAGNEKPGPR